MAVKERKALSAFQTYKAAKTAESVKKEYGLDNIIKLAGNENRYGFPVKVKEAINKYLTGETELGLYPDMQVTELRDKLSKKLSIAPEQFVFGNGSFELISIIAQTYLEAGDESIYTVPSFNWYSNVTKQMGAVPIEIPAKAFAVDLHAIEEAVTDKTKVIWICNPNNPTGTKLDKELFYEFMEHVSRNILIVLDEAYIEFVEEKNYISAEELVLKYDNIISLRTFSKLYGLAGFRVGYGFANQSVIGSLVKAKLPINVSTLSQIAASASLDDTEFVEMVLENNRKGRELYYDTLDRLGLPYIESNTNFILFDTGHDSLWVEQEYLKHGILIRPAAEFGLPTWVRATIGKYEDNVKALKILEDLLK